MQLKKYQNFLGPKTFDFDVFWKEPVFWGYDAKRIDTASSKMKAFDKREYISGTSNEAQKPWL